VLDAGGGIRRGHVRGAMGFDRQNEKAALAGAACGRTLASERHRLRAWVGVSIERRRWIEVGCIASVVLRANGGEVNGPVPRTPASVSWRGVKVASDLA